MSEVKIYKYDNQYLLITYFTPGATTINLFSQFTQRHVVITTVIPILQSKPRINVISRCQDHRTCK
jgi:hypothetical protein